MEKLTIKDIAKLAGVSPSSVSIVINGKKGVSDKTRAKVLGIIEKMQYTPNPSSRRLVLNKTNNIAVLFNKDTHPLNHLFHSELNSIIVSECESRGYNLVFTSAAINNDIVQLPNVIRSHDVDGVIFYGDPDPLIENALKQHELPYISVDSHLTSEDKLSVRADYETAAYVAVKYLVELGHTKIAFIGNHALQYHYAQTFSGFTKVLDEQDIKIPVNWIQFRAYNEEAATMCMDEILHGSLKPTAVFCSADIYAIGAMKSIKKHNLKIPQDISIIGIDDILLCQYVSPTLTTIKIDKHKMGKVAVDLIIDRIENHNTESRVLVASTLVVRESTPALSNS
jgi:LacI family transcriptional regulator